MISHAYIDFVPGNTYEIWLAFSCFLLDPVYTEDFLGLTHGKQLNLDVSAVPTPGQIKVESFIQISGFMSYIFTRITAGVYHEKIHNNFRMMNKNIWKQATKWHREINLHRFDLRNYSSIKISSLFGRHSDLWNIKYVAVPLSNTVVHW